MQSSPFWQSGQDTRLKGIGIYTSPAPSPKGEQREGFRWVGIREDGKRLILFSSAIAPALLYLLHPCSRHPSPLQQGRGLGASATHCFYYAEKLCRYLWLKGAVWVKKQQEQGRSNLGPIIVSRSETNVGRILIVYMHANPGKAF